MNSNNATATFDDKSGQYLITYVRKDGGYTVVRADTYEQCVKRYLEEKRMEEWT